MVSMRKMSMMAGCLVVTSLMVLGSLPMMSSGVFMVFGRLLVMLRTFMPGHFRSLLLKD
jgi:hypothetical protein